MGQHQLESLIKMANQISSNNSHLGEESRIAELVCSHLQKFWSRGMKQQIIEYVKNNGEGLSPAAQRAVQKLAA